MQRLDWILPAGYRLISTWESRQGIRKSKGTYTSSKIVNLIYIEIDHKSYFDSEKKIVFTTRRDLFDLGLGKLSRRDSLTH